MLRRWATESNTGTEHDGIALAQRPDGSLRIDVDMGATPWPYNAWSWATMLPGVQERLLSALMGSDGPLVVSMYRTRPRRAVDVVLTVEPWQLGVHNMHAGVEHTIQIAASDDAIEQRLSRVASALVDAVVHGEGLQLRAVGRRLPVRASDPSPAARIWARRTHSDTVSAL